eukprot:1155659-Pelagomonas_calceolata.AAC.3
MPHQREVLFAIVAYQQCHGRNLVPKILFYAVLWFGALTHERPKPGPPKHAPKPTSVQQLKGKSSGLLAFDAALLSTAINNGILCKESDEETGLDSTQLPLRSSIQYDPNMSPLRMSGLTTVNESPTANNCSSKAPASNNAKTEHSSSRHVQFGIFEPGSSRQDSSCVIDIPSTLHSFPESSRGSSMDNTSPLAPREALFVSFLSPPNMSSLLVPHPSGFLHTLHATLCFAAMRLCRAHSRSAFPGDHAAHPHAWARPAAGVAWAACAHGCGIRGGASGGRAFEWCPRCDREHRVLDVTWHSMPCGVESQEDVQTKGAQGECHCPLGY